MSEAPTETPSSSASTRGRGRRGAWVWPLLALGLAAGGCGPAPEHPRAAVRLAAPGAETADRTVLALRPEPDDTVWAPGQLRLAGEFDSRPGRPYVVTLRYARAPGGLGPTLFGGPAGAETLSPLGALAGGRAEGRLEVELVPSTTRTAVEARLPRGPPEAREGADAARLHELVVTARPDPWTRGPAGLQAAAAAGADARPATLELYRDARPGWVLRPGDELLLPQPLPEGATRLRLALARAHHLARPPAPSVPAELVLRLVRADGLTRELGRVVPEDDLPLWESVELSLDDVGAGAGARVHLSVDAGPAAGAGLAVGVPVALVERGARRPNLVLVSIDTLRRDRLGLYGYERGTTPHLDALAECSLVFDDALATAPYTLPSHASMFSGQYPTRHGAQNPVHAVHPGRTPLLAERLAAAGWATRAATGGGYLDADYGLAHGFGSYGQVDPVSGAGMLQARGRAPEAARRLVAAQGWSAALDWIEEHREVPFFLFLQTFAVHDYQPPDEWRARFDAHPGVEVAPLRRVPEQRRRPYTAEELGALSDRYDAGLAWVDEHVGALLARLDALDLTGHTLVVVTSDHGEAFGERGLNGHGHSLHAEQLRVPLLLSWPAPTGADGTGPGLPAGRVARRVSLVDLAPTLLDLLGLAPDEASDGRSLRPLWEGDDAGFRPSPALAELDSNVSRARALYSGPAKLILADPEAAVELPAPRARSFYDVLDDPEERRELLQAGDPRAARAPELEEALRVLVGALEARGPGASTPVALDEDTRRRLQELGYLDAGDGR